MHPYTLSPYSVCTLVYDIFIHWNERGAEMRSLWAKTKLPLCKATAEIEGENQNITYYIKYTHIVFPRWKKTLLHNDKRYIKRMESQIITLYQKMANEQIFTSIGTDRQTDTRTHAYMSYTCLNINLMLEWHHSLLMEMIRAIKDEKRRNSHTRSRLCESERDMHGLEFSFYWKWNVIFCIGYIEWLLASFLSLLDHFGFLW